jgi:hypothetical protein
VEEREKKTEDENEEEDEDGCGARVFRSRVEVVTS